MHPVHSPIQNIQFFFACVFFASLNFEVFSPIIPNLSIAKMAAVLYMGALLLTPKNLFSVKKIKLPIGLAFAMFFLMVLSSIIHMQTNQSIFNTTLFLNIILFWLLLNHQRRDERVLYKGLFWFSVSSFIVGVFYFLNIGVTIDDEMRVVVFGENANGLGVKMGTGVLFLLSYTLCHSPEKPIYRPWLLFMTIPMVSLLLATASRVSILVLGSGLVLFVLFRPSKRNITKLLWLLIGIIALYYGYQIVLRQETLMNRMERTIDEGYVSGRDYIWEKYIDLIEEHPILGVGFSGADSYAMEVFGRIRSPHNVIIEVAVYSGVLGLTCFLLFLFCIYWDAWRNCKHRKDIGALITSMAILGLVLSGQALGVKLFWTLAAYAISYRINPGIWDVTDSSLKEWKSI